MVSALYPTKSATKLLNSEQVFDYLLEHWEDLVEIVRWPQSSTEQIEDLADSGAESGEAICVCCGHQTASFGRGLLCNKCVRKEVGLRFNSIAEMVQFYRVSENK